jgi:predicted methyltransferase MtxX (methanogen marker protein 4)
VHAVAGEAGAVGLDGELGHAEHALDADVAGAVDPAHGVADRLADRLSSSRSVPVSMICTSAREPLIISLVRSSIGWEIEKKVEGTSRSSAFLKATLRPSRSWAVVHSFLGLRRTKVSLLSLPTGSMATSARPVMPGW